MNSSAPQCRCSPAQWAVLKNVRSGANQGRAFYSCPNFRNQDDKGCGFFLWAGDSQAGSNNNNNYNSAPPPNTLDAKMDAVLEKINDLCDKMVAALSKLKDHDAMLCKIDNDLYPLRIRQI